VRVGALSFAADEWERLRADSRRLLAEYHRQHPLRAGMPREEWRSRLGLSSRAMGEVVGALVAVGDVADVGASGAGAGGRSQNAPTAGATSGRGAFLRLPDHTPRLTVEQERAVAAVLARFHADPFAPPMRAEVEQALGPDLTAMLVERGRLVKLGETALFERAAYDEAVRRLVATLRAEGTLTVAAARDLLGTSRKYVLPFLEHLDERRITLRRGDDRILGPNAPPINQQH
jgi:selenocysteine-specific elongation factor